MGGRRAALLLASLALTACDEHVPPAPGPASRAEPAQRPPSEAKSAQPPAAPAPAFRFSFAPARRPAGWPRTKGVPWLHDAARSLARARKEGRAVLVYVGSLGCPHCRRLERGALSSAPFKKALRGVVPLAAYRFSNEDGDASATAVRTDVTTYPRLRFMDGWGRLLLPPSHDTTRSAILAQITRAQQAAKSARPPHEGAGLAAPIRRARERLDTIARTADVAQIGRHFEDADATVRLGALERGLALDTSLAKTKPLVSRRLLDANDHVRQAAYEGLKRLSPAERAPLVLTALREARELSRAHPEQGELRLAALEALTEIAPKACLPALKQLPSEVCGKEDGGCDQLGRLAHALWRKHRDQRVAPLLCEMLRYSSAKGHFSAADTQLALGVLGEVQQKDVLPPKREENTLRAAARAACGGRR